MRNSRRYAFTLIELITVMAISTILLGIIVVPMFQSFNATRNAQAFADAQDKARQLTERLTREISDSMGVKDVEGVGGRTSIVVQIPTTGVDDAGAPVATGGGWVKAGLNYTKLDIVLPAKIGTRGPGGGLIDPNTGKEDPTLRAPKGQVQLPLAPGTTIRRYWIGLRDPFNNYSNPYDGLLMRRGTGGRDNLFVLYMAEVEPVVQLAGVPTVNAAFFDVDPTDVTGRTPLYDDPDFFLPNGAAIGAPINNDAKADRVRQWQNRAQIVTELSRYDMILPEYDKNSRQVRMSFNGAAWAPRLTPLIQFRPSHVEGDSSDAGVTMPMGAETEGAAGLGSEVYVGKFGQWSSLNVRSYAGTWAPGQPYQIARKDANNLQLFFFDPLTGVPDTTAGAGTGLFDITNYKGFKDRQTVDPLARYPFSLSTTLAATALPQSASFMPFSVNEERGKISAAFPISEVGNIGQNPNAGANLFEPNDLNNDNLPQVAAQGNVTSGTWTITDSALTPITDPAVALGTFDVAPFFDAGFNRFNINRVFNKIWADAQANRNGVPAQFGELGGAHRFIDLRRVPQGDRTVSPLQVWPHATIVPNSEEIYGPDQNPGPNFGYEVRYRRVNKEPGPNEYKINYSGIPEPSLAGYNALGYPGVTAPNQVYDPTDFWKAIVQARYKAGYVQLCSNPEVPIPARMRIRGAAAGTTFDVPGRIRVAYQFQFTNSSDIIRVDYDTRQLMQILITIRNYPQSSVPNPQTVTMKATANVKNFIR